MKYKSKPTTVDAIQFTKISPTLLHQILTFSNEKHKTLLNKNSPDFKRYYKFIKEHRFISIEPDNNSKRDSFIGNLFINHWLTKDQNNNFKIYTDELFNERYEPC